MDVVFVIAAYILLIATLETMGQASIKYAFEHKRPLFAIGGPLMYCAICYILYTLYNFESMAIVNGWWNIATSISVTLSAIFIFGETLKKTDYFGLCMILLGAVFLNIDKLMIKS